MGLLSGKTIYGGWFEKLADSWADAAKKEPELLNVVSAVVTESEIEDGSLVKSVRFNLKDGGYFFEKLDKTSKDSCKVGDSIDFKNCKVITLSKIGEEDITRIRL